jgi:hypothetical protein
MVLLVTSAAGANGNGYGKLLAFGQGGEPLGLFSDDDRIADPRGLGVDSERGLLFINSGANRVLALDTLGRVVRDTGVIEDLNPGGGNFGPDGRYYIGLRSAQTVMALSPSLDEGGEYFLPSKVVPFPRGFAFGQDGRLFLGSGIGPNGEGDDAVFAVAVGHPASPLRLVTDPELSPLDLAIAPNGNLIVSSECPFASPDAITSIREYDAATGRLVRVFSADGSAEFAKPRSLRFGPDGNLYCVAQSEVVAFDFTTGRCLGALIRHPRLHGQALAFLP